MGKLPCLFIGQAPISNYDLHYEIKFIFSIQIVVQYINSKAHFHHSPFITAAIHLTYIVFGKQFEQLPVLRLLQAVFFQLLWVKRSSFEVSLDLRRYNLVEEALSSDWLLCPRRAPVRHVRLQLKTLQIGHYELGGHFPYGDELPAGGEHSGWHGSSAFVEGPGAAFAGELGRAVCSPDQCSGQG